MPAPTDPLKLDDAIRRYVAGEPVSQIKSATGVGTTVLMRERNRRGVPARVKRQAVDVAALVSAYLDGESELAISKRTGLSRTVIRRRLVEAEIAIRHPSEAGLLRAEQMSPTERQRQAADASQSRRGRKATPEMLLTRARNKQRDGRLESDGEIELARLLESRSFCPIPQQAIGKYNVDMAATDTIAVEVLGGNWHGAKRTHAVRTPYILNAGWHLIMVWNHKGTGPITAGAADYIAAFAEEIRWQPTLGSQYRVISGNGELLAARSSDSDEFPLVPPSRRAVRSGT